MAVAAAVGAIIAGLSAAGAAYAASLTMGWIIAAGVAAAAASYLASSMMMKVGDLGNTQYSSTSSQSSRSTSPSTGIPIVYGGEHDALIKTGSIIAWQNVQNDQSNYLCTVHCISIGEVDNFINQLYFDNVAVLGMPITQEGIVPSGYIRERFRPYLQLEVRFGGKQYDDSMSLAKHYGGSRWTDEMRGDGLVTITSVIRKTQDSQIDGILVNYNYALAVEMRGRKINDVLTNTIKTSSNPVSILTDYITDNYFGLGIDPADIDTDSFRIAAQYCENNQLRCNGTISYDKSFKRNIESILQTFGGVLYQSGSKFKIALDVADLSVASFNEDNIIGAVQLNSGSQNDYYNCIDASYTNPKNDYANDVIRFPSDIMESGILVKDGTIKKKDEDYLLVQDKGQLAFLVNPEILKSKYVNSTIQFNTYDALNVSVWDVITVTYDELGYVDKKFRVASKTLPFSAEQIGLCQLSCVEYYDEIYEGTDTGIFPQDGFKTNLPDASTVIAPANIQVVKKGTSSNGNIVTITWDHSTDHNLAGYYVKYRESTSSSWIEIGSVNKYTSSFEISLPTNRAYQFSVQAYNNLGYVSALTSTGNVIPEYSFSLPSITGLRLLNSTTSTLITETQDFRFQWDEQSHLVVNGKKFSDYFRYYEVRLYNGSTYIRSFNVTSTSFDLTHDLNTAGRKPTIGIIAHGFNTGTYSAEVKVTVENKQHAIPSNVSVKGGFGSLYVSWAKTTEKDYAGTQIAIVDSTNRSTVTNTTESEFTSINLDDGTYKIRVGHYDVFGTDNIIFSTEQTVTIKSDYQFSQEDVNNIQDLLDLSGELSTVLDNAKGYADDQMANAIQTANTNTTTKIAQVKSEIITDTGNKISASETKLTTSYTNADSALNQKITTLETSTNNKISDTNSKITTLEKTVSDGDKANSTLITNLDTKFTGQISTANSNVNNLSNAVSTQNAANANQFTLISSELNGNLFINPNADTTLPNGFDYNAVIVNVSEWPTAPTTNVYKVSGRDAIGTKAIPVTGGDTFNLSMFTATDIPNVLPVGIGLYVYDKNSNIVGYYYAVRRAASDQWVKIEGTVTIPIGGSHARVWVQIDQGHTGSNHWYVTGIQCSNANIYNKVNAQITQLNSTMVTADQANATAINQVQTNLNNNTATVNQKIDTSINTLTNNINSTYSLTAQSNGVVSGIKLVANSGATINSAIYFVADKFVVSPSASTANAKSPFTIDSGVVYLNNAMIKNASIGNALIADASITNAKIVNASINTVKIQDGTITNAKIANGQIDRAKITDSLQSDNYVANRSGMSIDFKNGSISINGNNSNGRMKIDNNSIQLIDSSGRVLLEMGIG
ncbi:phage tail tip fiber protein [Pectobacterium odoriferum]|uniref:phage tail tip fiber protein n=1 Tax=Pectobacterium odoriferum TaxID=78398 RepID=UPI001CF443DB|nr:fibronectin type III domain-containing protein [Pectobacterium odoriferum]MCA6962548.1 fibronectin type III domain-containing protein [Pectobacterium odoriferum]MCH5010644.1 fibronectin type III domain-containing protein [Pectobacterium odoriferum]